MTRKKEIFNPLEIHILLDAIHKNADEDKIFKEEWRKLPVFKRLYYWLETFYDLKIKKYFKKNDADLGFMIPDIISGENEE
jgi:hypothetical protein